MRLHPPPPPRLLGAALSSGTRVNPGGASRGGEGRAGSPAAPSSGVSRSLPGSLTSEPRRPQSPLQNRKRGSSYGHRPVTLLFPLWPVRKGNSGDLALGNRGIGAAVLKVWFGGPLGSKILSGSLCQIKTSFIIILSRHLPFSISLEFSRGEPVCDEVTTQMTKGMNGCLYILVFFRIS